MTIVLYDGLCGFCDQTVQWLLDADRRGALRFAALQGETAAAVRARHPEWPENLDSIVLVEGEGATERIALHSRAIFRICSHLGWPWRAAAVLAWIPAVLTDPAYKAFARIRYRIWGRLEACRLPRPEERARFLP
jgi:predicted DCC family thiol-disulfide oxidoreductase YuxK